MTQEWIAGRNSVIEALKSKREVHKLWIADGSRGGQVQTIIDLAKKRKVTVQYVPRQKIARMTDENHQGVIAQVAAYQYADIDDLFQRATEKNELPFFLILDELEDPHNLGSILRTADAAGVHGVIIPRRRAVGLTEVSSLLFVSNSIKDFKFKTGLE